MRELFTMQDSMDRLVNAFFDSDEKSLSDTVAPRVDLKQDEDKISIKMTIPGVDPENIQISVADNVLTVKAEVEEDKEETDEKSVYQIREHRWSSFYREISLPAEVEADKAKADYKNGVLKLELPKAEIVKPKVISISTGKKETA
jgi:HSP20 family protein